jgi:dynein light intermediate chain 1
VLIDTLARVSLYLLSQPSGEFASLVAPLLTPETIPHTALVILLDWSQPHLWLRQIWTWLQVFQEVLEHLSRDVQTEMEDVMNAWKERGRGSSSVNLDGTPSATVANGDSDGLPLCVVCQNVSQGHITLFTLCVLTGGSHKKSIF